jgi:hypothetical protein
MKLTTLTATAAINAATNETGLDENISSPLLKLGSTKGGELMAISFLGKLSSS